MNPPHHISSLDLNTAATFYLKIEIKDTEMRWHTSHLTECEYKVQLIICSNQLIYEFKLLIILQCKKLREEK